MEFTRFDMKLYPAMDNDVWETWDYEMEGGMQHLLKPQASYWQIEINLPGRIVEDPN